MWFWFFKNVLHWCKTDDWTFWKRRQHNWVKSKIEMGNNKFPQLPGLAREVFHFLLCTREFLLHQQRSWKPLRINRLAHRTCENSSTYNMEQTNAETNEPPLFPTNSDPSRKNTTLAARSNKTRLGSNAPKETWMVNGLSSSCCVHDVQCVYREGGNKSFIRSRRTS
jgi:hypothetical protein